MCNDLRYLFVNISTKGSSICANHEINPLPQETLYQLEFEGLSAGQGRWISRQDIRREHGEEGLRLVQEFEVRWECSSGWSPVLVVHCP